MVFDREPESVDAPLDRERALRDEIL
jgi:hypothetical protein